MFYKLSSNGAKNFIGVRDFTLDTLSNFLYDVKKVSFVLLNPDQRYKNHLSSALRLSRISLIFEESSIRTFTGFKFAAEALGARIHEIPTGMYSSYVPSRDNLPELLRYIRDLGVDAFVVRIGRNNKYSMEQIVNMLDDDESTVSIFSAGETGKSQPSQTLCDLYTVWNVFGDKFGQGGLRYVFVGDIEKSPTIHDFIRILCLVGARSITLVSNDNAKLPNDLAELVKNAGIPLTETYELLSTSEKNDVFYFTQFAPIPIQIQALEVDSPTIHGDKIRSEYSLKYGVTNEFLRLLPCTARVIHPGPVGNEFKMVPNLHRDPRFLHGKTMTINGFLTKVTLLLSSLNQNFYPIAPIVK